MPPRNAASDPVDGLLDRPAALVEFLAHAAERVPPSRAKRVMTLLAGPLPRWAQRPADARRVAAILQRLRMPAGVRNTLLRGAAELNPRFEPYRERRAPLPGEGSESPRRQPASAAEKAAAQWRELPPRQRTGPLDRVLLALETRLEAGARRGHAAPRPAAPGRLTRAQLIERVAEHAGMARAAAARAVDAIFNTASGVISEAVHGMGGLSVPGFGKFSKKERAARQGRNPRTGMQIDIPERTTITFTAGKGLKEGAGSGRKRTSGATLGAAAGAASGTAGGSRGSAHGAGGGSGGGRSGGGSSAAPSAGAAKRPGAKPQSAPGPAKSRRKGKKKAKSAHGAPRPTRPPMAPPSSSTRSRPPQHPESAPPPVVDVVSRPARAVNNGFAAADDPATPLSPNRSLQRGRNYAFWLEVGELVEGSIATEATDIDTRGIAPGSIIDVVLFPVGSGFRVLEDLGQLRLQTDGTVVAARQPGDPPGTPPGEGPRAGRLFFPVRTPDDEGEHRLRCNVYHGQTLLQSWLIRARVTAKPGPRRNALRSTADYVLARSLDAAKLANLTPHRLSVLMNGNGDGTHSFFFKGENEFRNPATLDAHTLQDLIDTGRGALRRAAWGRDEPWQSTHRYLYADGKRDLERLRADLERLARRGCDFYDTLADRLAGGFAKSTALRDLMRTPGLVQVASRESATHIVPAALFYDRVALDRGAPGTYTLCPAFLDALDDPRPLEEQPCFRGDCVSEDEPMVVCPSGFWGFRHALGMPLSVGTEGPDVEEPLPYSSAPGMLMAVWRDFVQRADHEKVLRALRSDLLWEYADTRTEALALLATTRSPVVYFYCHGGMDKNVPYLLVGGQGEGFIAPSNFRGKIRWDKPRPLVFINGCETAALEPEKALNFVNALVQVANASGVIGTEITIFEQLACDFAEEFLRRFVVQNQALGHAVRGARLALLKRGNPLGLVYIPFAIAALHLMKQA